MYQLCETLIDRLNLFGFLYRDNQKLFNMMPIFYLESVYVEDEGFKVTKTATSIANHIPILVLMSSFLI